MAKIDPLYDPLRIVPQNSSEHPLVREAAVTKTEFADTYSDLSPELVEIVRAVQAALVDKRTRLQLEVVDAGPSALESAFARETARRVSSGRGVASHPQLIAAVVEASNAAIISETVEGIVVTWNKGAEQIFGFPAEEVVGQSHLCLFPDFLKEGEAKVWKQVCDGEPITQYETVRQHKSGRLIDLTMSISPIFDDGNVVRIVLVAHDVTERKRMERALMDSERKQRQRAAELKAVLDSVPAAVWIAHDVEAKLITGNRAAYDLLRLPQGSNISLTAPESERPKHFAVYRNGRALAPHELPVQMAASRGVEVRDFEEDLVFDDGTVKHLIGNAIPLRDLQGNVYGAVAAFVDITARKAAEEQIRRMAHFDSLTNLPNRVLLMDRLEHAIAISQRNQSRAGVVFVDLDHFKTINDTLGHHVGDLLWQQVADRLRTHIREVDTVARLGGDEFLIVLPELRQMDDARNIARKMLATLSDDYIVSGQRLQVTPSLGISIFPDHSRDPLALIRLADQAMYLAKQSGRKTFRFYGDTAAG
jgi:diguanylate cyclase (GGDEF)-like protein/PAS domain S-box-containing protein